MNVCHLESTECVCFALFGAAVQLYFTSDKRPEGYELHRLPYVYLSHLREITPTIEAVKGSNKNIHRA